ncbi:synaptotagmin-10 isoform X1 [Pieris rapae]|uniref:synaptotagmin-10 isoform X1 n=1 Tax=Pieris rapae TaxID=64459 RepID=UPI001E2808DC|nr:synaptotagmin-10 isoform X1 [Pieris rapae]
MGVPRVSSTASAELELGRARRPHLLILDDSREARLTEESWKPEGIETQSGGVLGSSLDYAAALMLAAMAAVLLAAVGYQCAATWRWLMGSCYRTRRNSQDSNCDSLSRQAAIRISHSLPDLQTEPLKEEYVQEHKDTAKKVLRQTTLPIVPDRHQTFQRQLSHRLDLPSIQFSICSLERADSSIGLIKPELYKNELVRQSSTDSAELEFCGKLHFALKYDQEVEALVVKIFEARDLPIKDVTGSSDPYIKVFLLPDRKKKFQTKVHRKNLNPVFNETFLFSVPYDDLRQRYLQFSVYDFDRFSRHDLIGHVVLKGLLESADLTQEIEYTMNILAPPQEKKDLGELMLSLCYLPTAGRLTVTVIKGRNLKAMDINGSSDPYVKICLICQGKRIKKKKTTVKKNTLNPVYNEALVFDLPAENVYDVTLLIKVIDYDLIGQNELIGCTAIGSNMIGIGRDHWLEMLDNARKPVAQWYPLNKSLPTNVPVSTKDHKDQNAALNCLNMKRLPNK